MKLPKSKKTRILSIILGVLIVVFAGAGVYAYNIYHDVKETVNEKIFHPVESINHTPEQKEKIERQEPINFLLLGVDERASDKGRSDALMILSINPNIESMQIISIPRDTRTTLVGLGYEDKINHAYAKGDINTAIETVEEFAGIELDYYVKMNMEGLIELVDAVGGITVNNPLDWYDTGYYQKGFHYAKGELELDGPKTLGFVRMRYQDPNNDFGRNERQRLVIEAIIKKGASVGSITRIDEVLEVLGDNMQTNMNFEDMKNLFKNYRDSRHHTVTYQVTGNGQMINDIYYLIVSEEERQKVHDMIIEFNEKM